MTKFWWNRIMRWAKEWQLCRREERKEGGRKRGRNVFVVSWRLVPRCLVPSWISYYYWFWPSDLVVKGTWASTGHDVPEDGKGWGHSNHLNFSSEKWNYLKLQSPLCHGRHCASAPKITLSPSCTGLLRSLLSCEVVTTLFEGANLNFGTC